MFSCFTGLDCTDIFRASSRRCFFLRVEVVLLFPAPLSSSSFFRLEAMVVVRNQGVVVTIRPSVSRVKSLYFQPCPSSAAGAQHSHAGCPQLLRGVRSQRRPSPRLKARRRLRMSVTSNHRSSRLEDSEAGACNSRQ